MNSRGKRLIEFCEKYELIISNTIYEVPNRRRYTWKAPGDVRILQIDYILVKKIKSNQIKSSPSYPGFKIDSDHSLVMAKCNIKFKKRIISRKKNFGLDNLKNAASSEKFRR